MEPRHVCWTRLPPRSSHSTSRSIHGRSPSGCVVIVIRSRRFLFVCSDDKMRSKRFIEHFPSGFSVHDGHADSTRLGFRTRCLQAGFHVRLVQPFIPSFSPTTGALSLHRWGCIGQKGAFKHTSMNQRPLGGAESAWKLCPPLCCSCTPFSPARW